MRHGAIALLILAAAVAGWMLRGLSERGPPSFSAAGSANVPKASLPPEAVLAVHPKVAHAQAPVASKLSPIRQEINNASRSLGPIYARLAATNPRTPEEQWLMARLIVMCGRIVDPELPRVGTTIPTKPVEDARAKFMDALAPDDPDRDRRIAAYDALQAIRRDRCAEMKDIEIPRKDWRQLLESAAAGGDMNARLDLVSDDIAGHYRGQMKGNMPGLPTLTAPQVDAIKQAITTGDPYAISEGVRLLSAGYANMSLQDERGQAVDMKAFIQAGKLMACDAGYPCGEMDGDVVMGCAMFGRCAASNARDYTMFYEASPYGSQLIAQYQQALRNAVSNNDWSGFRFHAGPSAMPGAMLW